MQRKWRCDKGERSQSQSITIDIQRYTKRCNKIRFQQFQVSTVATAFLCLIDTWYNNSQFEGENKVISRFITIEIQRAQKVRTQGREEKKSKRNECRSNFQQHFFSSSHLKAGVCTAREQKQRDRTVKNPSEAFNLLLQQNFISTLIFFMRDEGRRVSESEREDRNAIALYNRNKYFMFLHRRFVWSISFSPQWKCWPKNGNRSGILHKCTYGGQRRSRTVNSCNRAPYTTPLRPTCILIFFCLPRDEREKICVTVVFSIALLLNFIDISFLPRAVEQRV